MSSFHVTLRFESLSVVVGHWLEFQLQDRCVICLEGFGEDEGDGNPLRTCRQCNSKFHQSCLAEWGRKEHQLKWEQKPWKLSSHIESGSCPCCRSNQGHDRAKRWVKL
eukprot:4256672-Amphidinium_carterae.1